MHQPLFYTFCTLNHIACMWYTFSNNTNNVHSSCAHQRPECSVDMIHINLNMIFYTHVEHSPTKTTHTDKARYGKTTLPPPTPTPPTHTKTTVLTMQTCISGVKTWMAQNKLKLNDHKTEALLIKSNRSAIMFFLALSPFLYSVHDLCSQPWFHDFR